jgi:hypothetical protein
VKTENANHEVETLQLKRSHDSKEEQLVTTHAGELNKFESVNAQLFAGLKLKLEEGNMALAESITKAAEVEKTVQLMNKQLLSNLREIEVAKKHSDELIRVDSANAELVAALSSKLEEVNKCLGESIATLNLKDAELEETVHLKDKQILSAIEEAKRFETELEEIKLMTKEVITEKLNAFTLLESQMQTNSLKFEETVQELTTMLVEKTKDLEQAEIDKADSFNKTEMFEVKVAKELSSKENQIKNLESMFKETVQELTSKLVEKTKDLQQAKTDTANKIGILQDKHANDLSRKQTQIKNLDSKVQEHICQVQKNEKLEATRKEVADGNDAYKKLEGDIKSLKESHESFRNAQEQKQAASRKSEQLESQVKTWTNEANWYW